MGLFSKIKQKLSGSVTAQEDTFKDIDEDYVELETAEEEIKSKIIIRPFILKDFEDIKQILDALREGSTIAIINIKPLKDKDLIELKRAINKLKKTTDALEGEIAGFGEDYIIATPGFAEIYRTKDTKTIEESQKQESNL